MLSTKILSLSSFGQSKIGTTFFSGSSFAPFFPGGGFLASFFGSFFALAAASFFLSFVLSSSSTFSGIGMKNCLIRSFSFSFGKKNSGIFKHSFGNRQVLNCFFLSPGVVNQSRVSIKQIPRRICSVSGLLS